MKYKKIILLTLLFTMLLTTSAFAQERKMKSPLFMGEVQEVILSGGENIAKIKVKGYIKNCTVYKEELIGIVSTKTILIPSQCSPESANKGLEPINPTELKINKGDIVFMLLEEAMTKSIPPQVSVKAIQISTQN